MEEIIRTVQKMWVVANYFHTIDVVKENEDEFAEACYRLLEDKTERERLGKAAQQWACSQGARASTHKLLDIYLAANASK